MIDSENNYQALAERLGKIEQQNLALKKNNRRLNFSLKIFLILLAVILLMGQFLPQQQTVKAKEFLLSDQEGKTRGALKFTGDDPTLTLYDPKGRERLELIVDKRGPACNIKDQDGLNRITLTVDLDNPAVALRSKQGFNRIVFNVDKHTPALLIMDEEGKPIFKVP